MQSPFIRLGHFDASASARPRMATQTPSSVRKASVDRPSGRVPTVFSTASRFFTMLGNAAAWVARSKCTHCRRRCIDAIPVNCEKRLTSVPEDASGRSIQYQ
jgi:ferredoxin